MESGRMDGGREERRKWEKLKRKEKLMLFGGQWEKGDEM